MKIRPSPECWRAAASVYRERRIGVPSGSTRVRLYDPGTSAPTPTVILLRGGGWVFGTVDSYDGFARQIAKQSGLRCLRVEYALAPEHPCPALLDDCIAAVRWPVRHSGINSRRVHQYGVVRRARDQAC
jgi:acetyl esterase